MANEIDKLNGHVIVWGFGRFGHVVVEYLRQAGREVVVVDRDPAHRNYSETWPSAT